MMPSQNTIKNVLVKAFLSKYGFAPAKTKIVLLEAHGDLSYILCRVGDWQYRYTKLTGVGCEKLERSALE